MSTSFSRLKFFLAAALLFSAAQRHSLAGSATWSSNPTSGDWNTAINWVPNTVPNTSSEIATFGASNVTDLSITNASVDLDSAVFNSGAPPYTLTIQIYNLLFYGAGIVNDSGSVQSIVAPTVNNNGVDIFFYNNSTAGHMTSFSTVGGAIEFFDTSSADTATFDLTSAFLQAFMGFSGSSTAADATINASTGSIVEFFDSSKGGNATLNLTSEAFVLFESDNDAEHMTGNCIGGNSFFGSAIEFEGYSTAGEGAFTTVGGSASGEKGAYIKLDNHATAGNATFVIGGGLGAGLNATTLTFYNVTTAANAEISANGGADGSAGGAVIFTNKSKGGASSITLSGNAELDISTHDAPGIMIGSLAGAGSVLLGGNMLTIGSNNQSTTFSGVVQGSGGVTKTGTHTFTLTGSNTYTGATTVNGGVLNAGNKRGSATGTGAVNVNTGTLGGRGIVSGPATIGTGSGSGAFLAPAVGSTKQTTLTIQSALTLKADATYTYSFKARRNVSRTDLVVANGVTINGATLDLAGTTIGSLNRGLILTLISNTSANPISGAFSNLPDGAIVNVNGNNLQASYEGGDGNDLTLTVQ
jgi:fibronectin-binding autotransporter adhesin